MVAVTFAHRTGNRKVVLQPDLAMVRNSAPNLGASIKGSKSSVRNGGNSAITLGHRNSTVNVPTKARAPMVRKAARTEDVSRWDHRPKGRVEPGLPSLLREKQAA
jgi:hypothetical protein